LIKLFNIYAGHKRGTKERKAVQIVLLTISLTLTYAVITNIVLPLLTHSQKLISLGVLSSVIFALGLSLSITKYKFLDIRLIVARSVAYFFSIGLIIAAFASISSIISFSVNDTESQVVNGGILILAILIYPYVKNFFDKATNQIFYRDAYDPQRFLNELNNTVVENIELGILLRRTTKVIQSNIKSDFCYVKIEGTSATRERLIGSGEFNFSEKDSDILREELARISQQTIITDEISSDFGRLKDVLLNNRVGLLIRLLPGSDMSKETLYYLILSEKKSGNIYNKQDKRIMEIIADELLIAIQNSLRFEEIEQFNVTLQQKVNDATSKLQLTNKKLRELDETKDEFISMASHQLRTPLTSVKGYMSMVLEGDAGKITPQQRELLNQAFVSSQRMVYLIADLLNVSRLKTGKFIIDSTPTNLAGVIEGEIGQLMETAKAKKIEISYEKR
jgi:K+-sensing histidine kinase KdpD